MIEIIAEAGVDHEGSWQRLHSLIDLAHAAGADTFKTQWYKRGLRGPNRELPWLDSTNMISAYRMCEDLGMEFLCTPHDEWALDKLVDMELIERVKIGSGGWHLIPLACETKLPLLISCGMHIDQEVCQMHMDLAGYWHTFLHCVSEYPTPTTRAQLRRIPMLSMELNRRRASKSHQSVGYSDHTEGIWAPLAAAALDACTIEKHIRLDAPRYDRQDSLCAVDRQDFIDMCWSIRQIEAGCSDLGSKSCITPGEKITEDWLRQRETEALERERGAS
jgi:N,N'-diacetyllegionaminate synthase|tara:strand:+ start:2290 stop:3117 length:828 start_codon:yes stop_codon:yes gene_type:complete